MKKCLIWAVILLVAASVAEAKMSKEDRAAARVEYLKTELKLSDDQVAELQPAVLARIEVYSQAWVRENKDGDKEQAKEMKKSANKAWQEALKSVLTAEQMSEFKARRAELNQAMEAIK